MKAIILTAMLALAGCAATPKEPPPKDYSLGSVTTKHRPGDEVDRECNKRFTEYRQRWGCAIYNRETRSCTIITKEPLHKLDWDRMAILGIELWNCNKMSRGEM